MQISVCEPSVKTNSRSDHTGYYSCTSYTEESVETVVHTSFTSCGYISYPNFLRCYDFCYGFLKLKYKISTVDRVV